MRYGLYCRMALLALAWHLDSIINPLHDLVRYLRCDYSIVKKITFHEKLIQTRYRRHKQKKVVSLEEEDSFHLFQSWSIHFWKKRVAVQILSLPQR